VPSRLQPQGMAGAPPQLRRRTLYEAPRDLDCPGFTGYQRRRPVRTAHGDVGVFYAISAFYGQAASEGTDYVPRSSAAAIYGAAGSGEAPSLKAGTSQEAIADEGTFLDPPAWTNQCATDMRGETNAHVVAFLPWGRCRHCDGRIARSCSAPRRDCLRPCVAFRGRLSHQSRPCGIDPRPFRGSDNLPAGVSGVDQATEIRFTTPGTQTSPVELMSPIRKAACGDADDQCSVHNRPDFRPPNHCACFRAAGKGQWRCRLTRHRAHDRVTARGTGALGY
jgi:hypothetical protein